MPEKTKAKAIKTSEKTKKTEDEVVADVKSEASDKELLLEAEQREKARKEIAEEKREKAKEDQKEARKEQLGSKKADKQHIRVKPRHGKKYQDSKKLIEKGKYYELSEAVTLLKQISYTKFEPTVDIHIKLSKKLENVRGTLVLPGGLVKAKKVLVASEKNIDQIVTDVKSGKINFDVLIASSSTMPKLAQLAKILGPRGLMPNPKTGTVVDDTKKAADEFAGGKVEYKADKANIVHLSIGKVKADKEKIVQNAEVLLHQFPEARIDSAHLALSMGPSIKIKIK